MSYAALIIFVVAFWAAAAFYPKWISLRVGGSISYRAEFFSTVSIVLVWCGIGIALNLFLPWLGTYVVIALHVMFLALTVFCVIRARRIRPRPGGVG